MAAISESLYRPLIVTKVIDGDTIKGIDKWNKEKIKIRLYGVDTPELHPKSQPFGLEAKLHVEKLVEKYKDQIYYKDRGRDRYGRTIASIEMGPKRLSLAVDLLENGLAWVYKRYIHYDFIKDFYIKASDRARFAKIGIWSQPDPINPEDFRHRRRR